MLTFLVVMFDKGPMARTRCLAGRTLFPVTTFGLVATAVELMVTVVNGGPVVLVFVKRRRPTGRIPSGRPGPGPRQSKDIP